MADKIVPGKDTTEYAVAKSAGLWGVIGMILGFISVSGSQILEAAGVVSDSTVGVIGGSVIAFASLLLKTLSGLGYIKSRTDVKVGTDSKK